MSKSVQVYMTLYCTQCVCVCMCSQKLRNPKMFNACLVGVVRPGWAWPRIADCPFLAVP